MPAGSSPSGSLTHWSIAIWEASSPAATSTRVGTMRGGRLWADSTRTGRASVDTMPVASEGSEPSVTSTMMEVGPEKSSSAV